MNAQEREQMLRLLREGRGALRRATAGLSAAQVAFRPDAGQWSAQEVAEHVAIAEEQMLYLVRKLRRPADPAQIDRRLDELILRRGTDRKEKRVAPEIARPTGRYASLEEAVARYEACRDRTLRYVEDCAEDLHGFSVRHPVVGVIDCYQCLLVMTQHPLRHEKQIEELRQHPSFPKS